MTFGSLFAGIGGLDLGLERAGMECRWQIEIDAYCTRVLAKHWPGVKRYGDIRTVHGFDLERVDLICGGFPCQDLSQAGKRAGIEGTRSGLWFEFSRLVGELGPGWVVIENVSGLLVHRAMQRVVGDLARLGYVGWWRSLRAADFGASHLRKRIFIVAHCPGGGFGELRQSSRCDGLADGSNPELANPEPGSAGAVLPNPGGTGLEERGRLRGDDEPQCATAERIRGAPDVAHSNLPGFGSGGWNNLHGEAEPRRIALPDGEAFAPGPADPRWPAILAARPDLAPALESPVRGMADGVPDWLDGAMRNRTKRLGRLGNAVVPDVAEWIGRRIREIEAQA